MPLTDCQQQAVTELFAFLTDPEEKMFVLAGPAGSGKTYMLEDFQDNFDKQWEIERVIDDTLPDAVSFFFTATTNKAATVLQENGINATTVHSFLGLITRWDPNNREHYLTKRKNAKDQGRLTLANLNVLFVDEASMIGRDLYKYIEKWVKDDIKRKVVFIGDRCQLPPINETEAVPFSPFLSLPGVTLQEVVRQGESTPLASLVTQFRKAVTDDIPQKVTIPPEVKSFEAFKDDDEWYDELFSHMPDPGSLGAVVLCYTNATVSDYTRHLRDHWGIGTEPEVGEAVCMDTTVVGNDGRKVLWRTGDLFVIGAKEPAKRTIQGKDFEGHFYADNLSGNKVFVPKQRSFRKEASNLAYRNRSPKSSQESFEVNNIWGMFSQYHVSTVHKSQGSTYPTVFLDMTDFSKCRDKDTLHRLLYVAASRASHNLFIRR
jgi:hypothetical protein